jgi:hypothetical protein
MSPHLIPFSRWLTGRWLTSPPPPLDAPALGATAPLLPAIRQLEPFVGEEREYTHFRSWEGAPELSAPACGIRWTCYSDESARKGHIWDVVHYVLEMVSEILLSVSHCMNTNAVISVSLR